MCDIIAGLWDFVIFIINILSIILVLVAVVVVSIGSLSFVVATMYLVIDVVCANNAV
jgi:hypothetical protein